MASYNKVLLMGNLTRDPELRYLPSGMPVVSLGLAVNRRWKNPQGETQEETTFVDCEAFARTAEVLNQYLRKGRPLFVEGRLKLDQWQDQQGNPRSRMKVIVESFNFIDSRQGGDGGEGGGGGDHQGGRSDYQGGGQGGGGYPARGPAAASGGGRGGYNAPAQRSAPPSAGPASGYNAPSAGHNAPPQDVPDHVAPDDSDIPF